MLLDRIPYVLEGAHVVLRSYDPRDEKAIGELFTAICESREHLAPSMAWPDLHQKVADTAAWVRSSRANFEAMSDFVYGVYARDDNRLLGGTGLHVRGEPMPVSIEIGYWLRPTEVGRGYARELARLLTRLALAEVHAERVVIRAQVDNVRSRRIPEALGFVFEGIARRGIRLRDQGRDVAIYSLLENELGNLPNE